MGSALGSWLLMLPAMMAPVIIPSVRHVRSHSLARRRTRAVALFLMGYVCMWTLAGAAVLPLLYSGHPYLPLLVALAAASWHVSPLKQWCLNRCHAHPPLAAFGLAADLDASRFGLIHGVWCVGSCWAPMLLPMLLPGQHYLAMACSSLWVFAERMEVPASPAWRIRAPRRALRLVAETVRNSLGGGSPIHEFARTFR